MPGIVKKVASNFSWLLFDRLFRAGLAFAIGVYVTRYLGPDQYGLLAYAQSLLFVFAALSSLGLDEILVRELVHREHDRDRLLGTVFGLRFLGALLTLMLLGVGLALGLLEDKSGALVLIIGISTLFDSFGVVDRYFQARIDSKKTVRLRGFALLLASGVRLLLILLKAPLVAFAWAITLTSTFTAMAYWIAYAAEGLEIRRWSFTKTDARMLLQLSWPVALAGLSLHIQARIDQVMLASYFDPGLMSQYAVAVRLVETTTIISSAAAASITPVVIAAFKKSPQEYAHRMVQSYRMFCVLSLLIGLPIYFLGEYATVIVYGEEFRLGGQLFSVFCIRLFITNLGAVRRMHVLSESLFRISLVIMLVASSINIVGNILLIPSFGVYGAYYATLISFASIFLLDALHPVARRNLGWLIRGTLTPWRIRRL